MGTGGFWNINTGGNLYASKRGKLVNVCSLNISCYFTAIIDEDTKMDKIRLRFAFCLQLQKDSSIIQYWNTDKKKKKGLVLCLSWSCSCWESSILVALPVITVPEHGYRRSECSYHCKPAFKDSQGTRGLGSFYCRGHQMLRLSDLKNPFVQVQPWEMSVGQLDAKSFCFHIKCDCSLSHLVVR